MPEARTLEERLRSVEQALTAQEDDVVVTEQAADPEALSAVESRVDDLEDRLLELEAGLQAVRGYVGNVNHVNEAVERRANAAVAAVERLESTPPRLATVQRPDESERGDDGSSNGSDSAPSARTDTHETDASAIDRLRTLL